MGISSLRLASLAVAGGFMLLFNVCQQEDVQVADSQNLIITNDQTRAAGPSANGHGTITLENIPIDGEGFRHFTFHAKEQRNGSVQGNGVLTYIGGVRNLSFDIDCLSVDGTLAVMSGVITRDNQFPENVGQLCWFKVRDNGEGNNSDPDQITLFFSGTDPLVFDCAINYGNLMYDIEGGNVQVRE
jgi:hypothetical protein